MALAALVACSPGEVKVVFRRAKQTWSEGSSCPTASAHPEAALDGVSLCPSGDSPGHRMQRSRCTPGASGSSGSSGR